MEVVCKNCNARLNIPDEKLPRGQRVRVSCPRCKNKLILDASGAKPAVSAPAVEEPAESGRPKEDIPGPANEEEFESPQPEGAPGYDDVEEDTTLDSYEEGEKLALVMDNDAHHTEKIKEALEELGYRYVPAENSKKAVSKIRFHNFDLVVLADNFDNLPLEQSPILRYLSHLSMSIRRRIFLALIGERFKTMDHMMEFSMSANLVINSKDLGKLASILKRAVSDNEKFYKVFFDTLEEVGKA